MRPTGPRWARSNQSDVDPVGRSSSYDRRVRPDPQVTVTHVGPIIRVERHEFASTLAPDGTQRPPLVRDVVRHPGAVTVIAVRNDGILVLVRNRRIAVAQWLVEFCAGKLERGEDPADAARRELEEETGYAAGRIERLGSFFTSPGFTDEIMHVFLATDLAQVPQRLEPGEELEVVAMSRAELARAIALGEITDGKTLGAFLLWTLMPQAVAESDRLAPTIGNATSVGEARV